MKNNVAIKSGNELIILGALEAGFHFYTGYPGSPLADFFNILNKEKKHWKKKGIRVAIANSESQAAAMAQGAKQAGKNTLIAMKSMGLNVASDALLVGNFSMPGPGGVVVVVGDDPFSISTSAAADSRYLFKHLHMPFLEPSSPDELRDWIQEALQLSISSSLYVGVLLSTFMAEGGGSVLYRTEKPIDTEPQDFDPENFNLEKNVMVPPNSFLADHALITERFPKVFDSHSLNKTFINKDANIGFISAGLAYQVMGQVLADKNLLDQVSILKIAMPYPLSPIGLKEFLEPLKSVIIVEEKRGFLEDQIRAFIQENHLSIDVIGKNIFPAYGGLNYEHVEQGIGKIFPTDMNNHLKGEVVKIKTYLPKRLPTFCPGCPHRETLSLLRDLRLKLKHKKINLISHGDVGCYSLSFLPPFKEMHNLSAMGQGGALGAGFDLFAKNPSIVLMGDSTFFHSGMSTISNSVQMNHQITYIILDNDNTAMTGHQYTPSSGKSIEENSRPKQDIKAIVDGLQVAKSLLVNPSDRYFYQNVLQEMIALKGVKVIISTKECALTFAHRSKRENEENKSQANMLLPMKTFYQINTDACVNCLECIAATGCPGLTQTEDPYGKKMAIDPQICIADSYCTKIKACPSFELIEVHNYKLNNEKLNFENIEVSRVTSKIKLQDIAEGKNFRVVITGVGGTGVTTLMKVLAHASKNAITESNGNLAFKFVDQKGLAQRNGNVTSHFSLYQSGKCIAPITPYKHADLILSPDFLDLCSQLRYLNPVTGNVMADLDFQIPLNMMLDDEIERKSFLKNTAILEIKNQIGEKLSLFPFKKYSYDQFKKNVYSMSMILGAAYQAGLLPFDKNSLEEGIKSSVSSHELKNNLDAFFIGQLIFDKKWPLDNKKEREENPNLGDELYKKSIKEAFFLARNPLYHFEKSLELLRYKIPYMDWPLLIHDQIIYNGGKRINEFIKDALDLHRDLEPELAKIAIQILARTYFIKDEVWVAHQMISPMRREQDFKNYGLNGSYFKKTFINRPRFEIGNQVFEFDYSPDVWQLKIFRHFRMIRKLLPLYHLQEKRINLFLRQELKNKKTYSELKELDSVKGYRDILFSKVEIYKKSKGINS